MVEHRAVTCVLAILFNRHHHILFQQRDNTPAIHFPNYWPLLGGHVELGEQRDDAMLRELFEEIEFTGEVQLWSAYDLWRSRMCWFTNTSTMRNSI